MSADKCKCSMAIRTLGDGCKYCNPQLYIEILEQQTVDNSDELEKCYVELRDLKCTKIDEFSYFGNIHERIAELEKEIRDCKSLKKREQNGII